MKQKKLYTLSKQTKKINGADRELWMKGFVIYPLIIFLSIMDGLTLYDVFFRLTSVSSEASLYVLTVGVALVLNFIPLVVGRYIHYYRYGMNGVKRWMIVALVAIFFVLFFATFYLRWEARDADGGGAGILDKVIDVQEGDKAESPEDGQNTAFTLLMGVIPLVTSAVNLALGYMISDPVKRRLDTLRHQRALLQEQINRMHAAEYELNQNWAAALAATEEARLATAKETVHAGSEQIRQAARLALAEKLGDAESISELTDT